MSTNRVMRATHILLRLVVGLLFLQHGGQKLFGWFGGAGGASGATVELMSLMGLAGLLEFGGGILIVLGLLTRPVALLLSGEMAVAYFKTHQSMGTWPIQNHGELAAIYSFVWLFFAAHGAGGFSLDALMSRHRRHTAAGRDSVPETGTEDPRITRIA